MDRLADGQQNLMRMMETDALKTLNDGQMDLIEEQEIKRLIQQYKKWKIKTWIRRAGWDIHGRSEEVNQRLSYWWGDRLHHVRGICYFMFVST